MAITKIFPNIDRDYRDRVILVSSLLNHKVILDGEKDIIDLTYKFYNVVIYLVLWWTTFNTWTMFSMRVTTYSNTNNGTLETYTILNILLNIEHDLKISTPNCNNTNSYSIKHSSELSSLCLREIIRWYYHASLDCIHPPCAVSRRF